MELREMILIGLAVVFGALWLMRRRSRTRSDKFD
jgi:hypothetical protein